MGADHAGRIQDHGVQATIDAATDFHFAGGFRSGRTDRGAGHPQDRDATASAIRGLFERIVLTPSAKWAETVATRRGDLGTILEWKGNGCGNTRTDIPRPEMLVSVVAGAGFEPATFGL